MTMLSIPYDDANDIDAAKSIPRRTLKYFRQKFSGILIEAMFICN